MSFASKYISEIESGKGLVGGAKSASKQAMKDIGKKFTKDELVRAAFGGDDIFSALIRQKFDVRKKSKTSPSKLSDSTDSTNNALTDDSASFIKIIAKNSMSLHLMAREVNVMRQNVQKLVQLRGAESKGGADKKFFLSSNEREKKLEAERAKNASKGATPVQAAGQAASSGGGFFSVVGAFLMTIVQQMAIAKIIEKFGGKEKIIAGIKKVFSPANIKKAFSKVFAVVGKAGPVGLIITAIVSVANGFIDAIKEFVKSGSIKEAYYAFLGGILEVITFGLADKDTVKKYLSPIIDPIFDTITNVFGGLKDFVQKIFGVSDKTSLPAKTSEPAKSPDKPSTPGTPAAPSAPPPKPAAPAAPPVPPKPTPVPAAAEKPASAPSKVAQADANLDSLEMSEGDLQQLFMDLKREKGRVSQELVMKYPDGFVDDPSSPEYPPELKAVDDKYKPLIDAKKKEIQKLKGAPGVKEAMKRRDKDDDDWDEVEKAATKPSKTSASKFTTKETVEISGGGSTTTSLAKSPDAKAAEKELMNLDDKQAAERKKLIDKLKAEGKIKGRVATSKDYAANPELAALKEKQDQERAALINKIDSGTSVKTTTTGGAPSASGVSSGGSSGGGSSPSVSPGGGAASGQEIGSSSASVAEGQRMESAADAGSVVNAPTNNNQSGSSGPQPKQMASAYNDDLAETLATT
jgi:hypothetical protein